MNLKRFFIFILFLTTINLYAESLPNGYGDIKLGMSVDDTKSALKKNSDFGYHGDRDVSLLPGENRTLIETDGTRDFGANSSFLERCWFQFSEEKLYIITINVNQNKMDYYSIFTKLCQKYGKPNDLNPDRAVWKNDSVTMSLEKPLTLKYVDNKTFENLKNKSNVLPSATEKTREQFLDSL